MILVMLVLSLFDFYHFWFVGVVIVHVVVFFFREIGGAHVGSLVWRSIVDGIWIRQASIRSCCFDEPVKIQSIGISELAIHQTDTTTDNGAAHRSGNRCGNVRQQDFRGIGCNTTASVSINDGPQIQAN